jgi:hypothetical protein
MRLWIIFQEQYAEISIKIVIFSSISRVLIHKRICVTVSGKIWEHFERKRPHRASKRREKRREALFAL